MAENDFWMKIVRQRLSRRTLLRADAVAGVRLWAGSALACSSSSGEKQTTQREQADVGQPKYGSVATRMDADARAFDPHIETQTQASTHITRFYSHLMMFDYNSNMHNMTGNEEPEDYLVPYFGPTTTFYRRGNKDLYQKLADQEKYVRDQHARIEAIQDIEHTIQDEAAIAPLFIVKYYSFGKPTLQNHLPVWSKYVGYWAAELWRTDAWRRQASANCA